MENFVGNKVLKLVTKKVYGKELIIKDLLAMKRKGDKKAKAILQEVSEYYGIGIASLISVLDPEIIVLTGGVKETGDEFLNMIRDSVKKHSFLKDEHKIEWSGINEAGLLGASVLI